MWQTLASPAVAAPDDGGAGCGDHVCRRLRSPTRRRWSRWSTACRSRSSTSQQRTKLEQLSTQKPPPRQDVLNTLIDEILEVREAKRFDIDVPEVGSRTDPMRSVAEHMGIDAQKLTEMLDHAGASAAALKARLRAQMAWNALIRGRYKASLEIADTDVEAQLHLHAARRQKTDVGYEYTMRPIVFIVPSGSPEAAFEARKREADALRARFTDCADGITFARALDEVAVRDQVIKFSADLPQQSRANPRRHGSGPPDAAGDDDRRRANVCSLRQAADQERHAGGKAKSATKCSRRNSAPGPKRYLQKLRREAMIEYK